ncbi:MAG TPA: ROK family protein [Blastocatellia bacterium]|nr:ROK family protein [Blastocatellia bacterium]
MTAPKHTDDDLLEANLEESPSPGARILAIDIGGTGLKAAILNLDGEMMTERLRVETPHPITRDALIQKLLELIEPLGKSFDYVSVGFPGVVRKGKIVTAPNLGTEEFRGFDLEYVLEKQLGKPVRVLNDADMQGLAAIKGEGVEMVVTLGTGFGTAMFLDGELGPHLEIAHHPFRKGEDYDKQIGDKALKKIGKKKWNRRVKEAINNLRVLTNFDRLYIGGGNAGKVNFKLDPDIEIISNDCGVKGGAWLWRSEHERRMRNDEGN